MLEIIREDNIPRSDPVFSPDAEVLVHSSLSDEGPRSKAADGHANVEEDPKLYSRAYRSSTAERLEHH